MRYEGLDSLFQYKLCGFHLRYEGRTNSKFLNLIPIRFLSDMYKNSLGFKALTGNTGISSKQVKLLGEALTEIGDVQEITLKFVEVLCENKRFSILIRV